MAPIKFEENIKDKIESREIQPSADSWNKLASRLDAEGNKKKKSYWWLGIAASFIGLIIISVVMFNNVSDSNESVPIIVEENNDTIIPETENLNDDMLKESVIEEKSQIVEIEKKRITTPQNSLKKPANSITNKDSEDMVITKIAKTEIEPIENLEETILESKIIENKLNDVSVVADVNIEYAERTEVTDDEITTLLNNAKQRLQKKQTIKTANAINADQLLLDIETDLDQSFRDKIFEALQSGYKKVKTAVVDRNN